MAGQQPADGFIDQRPVRLVPRLMAADHLLVARLHHLSGLVRAAAKLDEDGDAKHHYGRDGTNAASIQKAWLFQHRDSLPVFV